MTEASQIAEAIDRITQNPPSDPVDRKKLHDAAQRLFTQLEEPHDIIYRILYSTITVPMTQLAYELEIPQTITKLRRDVGTDELASAAGADPDLTGRTAKWLAGRGMMIEVADGVYRENHITRALAKDGFREGVSF
jgi:hypothetical protein